MADLPDYERPPVTEVVVAVQFIPVPQFGMREAVAVSRAFDGWEMVDVQPALEPIIEPPPGQLATSALRFGLGMPPVRVILSSESERWLAQVQQDRLVVHERRLGERPTFAHVAEKVHEVAARAGRGLGKALLAPPNAPELVEVIYDNTIAAGEGWAEFSELHRVLHIVNARGGVAPYGRVEQLQIGFSYALTDREGFVGRLRVVAEPRVAADGSRSIHLQLISRRIVHNHDLDSVLEQSHVDIVNGFTAVTTERMHEIWGRFR